MSWPSMQVSQRSLSRNRADSEGERGEREEVDGVPLDVAIQLKENDSRPWYRKPSPWWILLTMPLSAMVLSGSGPSLLQIYIDIVCKSKYPDEQQSIGLGSLSNNSHHFLGSFGGHAFQTPLGGPNCSTDSQVQKTVSMLTGLLMTTQGVLSILTGASWASVSTTSESSCSFLLTGSQLSDRVGRRTVLAISTTAMFFCYGYYLLVFYATRNISNAFWILIIGPLVSGSFGGTAVNAAASNAYIADCTDTTSRARVFSLTLGMRFVGMAIGPTLCSVLVKASGTPIAAIVLVLVVHLFNLAVILFVIPESLTEARRAENKQLREEANARSAAGSTIHSSLKARLASRVKNGFAFVRPLAIVGPTTTTTRSGRSHKDYSLTFIALSLVCASVVLAQNQTLFLFAFHEYSWTAVRVGYWNSAMVAARAATLLVFLPAIIKAYHYYKSYKATKVTETSSEETPLIDTSPDPASSATSLPATLAAPTVPPHSPFFDLAIAQFSLILEVVSYLVLPLTVSPSHPGVFVALTVIASCGSGFGPAIQALSVELFTRRGGKETGRLFGVMSVLQIIVGPMLYSFVYARSFPAYPQAIFFVSMGACTLSVLFLFFVELPHGKDHDREEAERSA